MKSKKNKGFVRVATASILSVGLLGAGYALVASETFASTPHNTTPVVVHYESASQNFVAPSLTVSECRVNGGCTTPSRNALSMEKAAQYAARYIWDVTGVNVDGMHVEMNYAPWISHNRSYWVGRIGDSKEAMSDFSQYAFRFIIDATTGERIDLHQSFPWLTNLPQVATPEGGIFTSDIQGGECPWTNFSNGQREVYIKMANDFAQGQFNNTTITNIKFVGSASAGLAKDGDGGFVMRERTLIFNVTDESGRIAELSFWMNNGRLSSIITNHNDILPNFR